MTEEGGGRTADHSQVTRKAIGEAKISPYIVPIGVVRQVAAVPPFVGAGGGLPTDAEVECQLIVHGEAITSEGMQIPIAKEKGVNFPSFLSLHVHSSTSQ